MARARTWHNVHWTAQLDESISVKGTQDLKHNVSAIPARPQQHGSNVNGRHHLRAR